MKEDVSEETVQTRSQGLPGDVCLFRRQPPQEEGRWMSPLKVRVPFGGAVALEWWWAEAREQCSEKWRPWEEPPFQAVLCHTRSYPVRLLKKPRCGHPHSASVFAPCTLPRSRPQKNWFFVLCSHRRLSVKAGRVCFKFPALLFLSWCISIAFEFIEQDTQIYRKKNYVGAVIQKLGCSCQIVFNQSCQAFFKASF